MNPILTSILLGLTAAGANIFGGAIIVQRDWERRYLKYFVALGAGFMLATALVEVVPTSLEIGGRYAAFLVLLGYLIIHFFEHTVTPHFHFGEETHQDEFVHPHKGFSVLMGLLIHTFFDGIAIASGFLVSNWLGWISIRASRSSHVGRSPHHGALPPSGKRRTSSGRRGNNLCSRLGLDSRSEQGARCEDGLGGLLRSGMYVLAGSFFSCTLRSSFSVLSNSTE